MKFFLVVICVIGSLIDIGTCAPSVQDIGNASNSTLDNGEKLNYRLNTDILPLDYIIELTPYFNNETDKEAFTFDGSVKITLQATKADVNTITLHKEDLNISEQILTLKSKYFTTILPWESENISINHNEYDDRTRKYHIILTEPLVQNQLYVR